MRGSILDAFPHVAASVAASSADDRTRLDTYRTNKASATMSDLQTARDRRRVPKVSLAFRVGVVGHRPNRLTAANPQQLKDRMLEILEIIGRTVADHFDVDRELYGDEAPVLRALSPLAEGVDRIFAEQALAAGYELNVVLPFAQAEFEKDFTGTGAMEKNSLERFRELLAKATTTFQSDGSRDDSSRSYKVAGDVVLNQSDVLIVVWDGERKNLRGGTEETFDDALTRGVPAVWIDAHAPHAWQMVTRPLHAVDAAPAPQRATPAKSDDFADLQGHVRRLLEMPPAARRESTHDDHADAGGENPRTALESYYAEVRPNAKWAVVWQWFRDFVADGKFLPPSIRVKPYEEAVVSEWPRNRATPVAALVDRLRPFYAWADKSAVRYADAFRSAFIIAYILAAVAVAMALGPLLSDLFAHDAQGHAPDAEGHSHGLGELVFAVAEFLAISLILIIVWRGRRSQWHRRWLDYRLLAEWIRHQRFAAILGGRRVSPSVPEQWTGYGNPAASWMAWYARAVERSLGLPGVKVDTNYLAACMDDLERQLEGQVRFHTSTSRRLTKIEHRLHAVELFLFLSTLVCCGTHVVQWVTGGFPPIPGNLLMFWCGVCPALGAALVGINNQGEFKRIARRSAAMRDRLGRHLEAAGSMRSFLAASDSGSRQLSAGVAELSNLVAKDMVNEVLDWRIIFEDRPLKTT
jgi:hypothetical protein